MKKVKIHTDSSAKEKIKDYPKEIQIKLLELRELILEVASEINEITELEETLKWGQLSYVSPLGSTIRIDWKPQIPNNYYMFFKCTSKLVPTFKKVFGTRFQYEKNRAIIFNLRNSIPKNELKLCIKSALYYHKLKHLELLGL